MATVLLKLMQSGLLQLLTFPQLLDNECGLVSAELFLLFPKLQWHKHVKRSKGVVYGDSDSASLYCNLGAIFAGMWTTPAQAFPGYGGPLSGKPGVIKCLSLTLRRCTQRPEGPLQTIYKHKTNTCERRASAKLLPQPPGLRGENVLCSPHGNK